MVPNFEVRHPFDPDADGVAFVLGEKTYLLFEDPDDGYRSSLGAVLVFDGMPYELAGTCGDPLNKSCVATMSQVSGEEVLEFRTSQDSEPFFRVGTSEADDYYPSYIAQWHPENI